MITIDKLSENIKTYASLQLDQIARDTPLLAFIKPLLVRAVNSNLDRLPKILEFITDSNGNIDVEGILSEMIQSIVSTQKFSIHTKFIGDIQIGEGQIVFDIPFINKQVVLGMSDIEQFKEIILSK